MARRLGSQMAVPPDLRAELLTLTAREREDLADQRYESLEAEPRDPDWEQAWSQEIGRRVAEISSGRVALVDADEVHRDLRAELRDPRH